MPRTYKNLKEIHIGPQPHQTTKIGTSLSTEQEGDLIDLLRKSLDLFAWQPSDMLEIDPSVVCRHLVVNPRVRSVIQRKCKMGKERRKVVDEDVKKLKGACFISEIKYPTWMENCSR